MMSLLLYKGEQLLFLYAFLEDRDLPKWDLLSMEIASRGANSLIAIEKGGKNKIAELFPLKLYTITLMKAITLFHENFIFTNTF